jgi:hypothetical protein
MSSLAQRRRCKVEHAAEILGESSRTIRNKAASGQIPGAANLFGTWTFDIATLLRTGSTRHKFRHKNRGSIGLEMQKSPCGAGLT